LSLKIFIIAIYLLNKKVGNGYMGDIAIDDIFYASGTCPIITTTTAITTISYPLSSLDCNFDMYNMCSWLNDTTANFNWTINKGETASFLRCKWRLF